MKKLLILFILCGITTAVAKASDKPVILAENGKPLYQIVVSSSADSNILFAAGMLQKYLEKISGAKLPLVTDLTKKESREIVVGFSNRTQGSDFGNIRKVLPPDGYRITTRGKQLFILGGSDKGSIYGVVELLERYLGCRNYSPGTVTIPHRQVLSFEPIEAYGSPVNTFRVVNGSFCSDPEYKAWQRLDEVEDVFAKGYYVHTMGKLIPWESYYNSHPEYFAFLNGKRVIDQPCLSNPEVFSLAIRKLKEEMALQPDKKVWSVSQNDNFSYCHCSECKKTTEEEGSPSGLILRFVNRVADSFPDKVISTLAYQYSRSAPKITRPRDNVQVMLCTIELNRSKSIESDLSGKQFVQDLKDWNSICHHLYLWDYTVNFSNHISPFPNLHVLQPNISLFTRNGALEHFQQSNTSPGHEFSELKSYLIARLLWNPEINPDSVINDFLQGYYGKAAPYIRDYIDKLEKEYLESGQVLDIYGSPVWNSNGALSADNMAVYEYLFDKAEQAVKDDKDLISRVRVARLPVQFAAMEIGKNDMFGPRGWYMEVNDKFRIKPRMKAMLESFNNTCRTNGVESLTESGLTPAEYYKSTLRFIDVHIENNKAFRKAVTASPLPSGKYSNGDLSILTNGVQGANDYKVHWLGWEAKDFRLDLDLETLIKPGKISMGTLYDPKSWILHPAKVNCQVSSDGQSWRDLGTIVVEGDQQKEEVNRNFTFTQNIGEIRYVRFSVTGTRSLPIWHPSAGGDSWVFVDEIIVE